MTDTLSSIGAFQWLCFTDHEPEKFGEYLTMYWAILTWTPFLKGEKGKGVPHMDSAVSHSAVYYLPNSQYFAKKKNTKEFLLHKGHIHGSGLLFIVLLSKCSINIPHGEMFPLLTDSLVVLCFPLCQGPFMKSVQGSSILDSWVTLHLVMISLFSPPHIHHKPFLISF